MSRNLAYCIPAIVLLFAGCLGPAGVADQAPPSSAACDLAYPDGAPIDCLHTRAVEPEADDRPALDSGWSCLKRFQEDGDPRAVFEVYGHEDGRAGLYWEAIPWKNPGAAFVVANVFEPEGEGQALVVNWTAKGFATFPEKPPAQGELHLLTRNMFVDVRDADGAWTPAASDVTVGRFGGHDWYVMGFEAGGASRHVDVVVPKIKEGSLRTFTPADRLIEGEGWGAYATVESWGVKQMEFPFGGGTPGGRCFLAGMGVNNPLRHPLDPDLSVSLTNDRAEERG